MFAVTGITGKVGSVVALTLLAVGKDVRAVVRDAAKAAIWNDRGCKTALADMNDVHALQQAFAGAEAVFVLLPPNFDPAPGFPESRKVIAALHRALETTRPGHVVCISTVGAHVERENLLTQLSILEQVLGDLPLPITFLRPAWYMENATWDVESAQKAGVIKSFLQPLDRRIPMVATTDVGRAAAELLQETWMGRRVVELEGPHHVSSNDIAAGLERLLEHPVRAEAVPRRTWESLFRSQVVP